MDMVTAAEQLATRAHAGQTDKAGRPYIDHPRRVAARALETSAQPEGVVVAWLHDVVEDTPVSLEQLRELGFTQTVVAAVDALTRRPGEGDAYYRRVAADELARTVKLADIWDNTHPDRTRLLAPADAERLRRKYEHAIELLTAARDWPALSPDSPDGTH